MKPCSTTMIKFLCSYGGKILPRYPDGKLRYHGGETRVLAVERSISFAELLVKLGEMCGTSVSLRCQLPTEDLDALVSITSDEDLANLIEEFDRVAAATTAPAGSIKIRAFLSAPKSAKKVSPSPSTASSSSNDNAISPKSSFSFSAAASTSSSSRWTTSMRAMSRPRPVFPLCYEKAAGKLRLQCAYHGHGNTNRHIYLVHNGNHWQ